MTGRMTGVTSAMTGRMTGVTGVADPGCCADSSEEAVMRAQYPDNPVLHGLPDETRIAVSGRCLIAAEINAVLGRIRGSRDFMGSVT